MNNNPNTDIAKPKENLKQRAYLNTVATGIDFLAKKGVNFFVIPIMVAKLGPVFFGVWQILRQLNVYMQTADMSAAGPLKYYLSRERSLREDDELRRSFTASVFSTILVIPIYIIAGVTLVWLAPHVASVDSENFLLIRMTSALLVTAYITRQIFALFEAVLSGMNLSYKRMGFKATINIIGGVLTITALYLEYGLIGLAAVEIIISVITGLTFWGIIKKHVPWLGFSRVSFDEVKTYLKLSVSFLGWKIVRIVNLTYDIILLGIFSGPAIVSKYVITRFLMTGAKGLIDQVFPALTAGIGKVLGEGDRAKLLRVRSLLIKMIWAVGMIVGATICLWNKSFISLWTSPDLFAGQLETFLIVIIVLQTSLQRIDTSLTSITLKLNEMTLLTSISVVVSVLLTIVLAPHFQIIGLLLALLIGNIILTIGYPKILENLLSERSFMQELLFKRSAVYSMLIFIITSILGISIYTSSWFVIIPGVLVTLLFLCFIQWYLIFEKNDREWVAGYANEITFFKR